MLNDIGQMGQIDHTELALDRHAQRRAAGIPTVSLLVGATAAGVGAFTRWAGRARRRLVRLADAARTDDLAPVWIEALGGPAGIRRAAIAWLAEPSKDGAETLTRDLRTYAPAARQILIERLIAGRYAPSGRLCLALFGREARVENPLPDPADLFADDPDPALAMLDALHGLGPDLSPASLLVSARPDATALAANVRLLAGLAERMADGVTAWALTQADWQSTAAAVPESRFKAMCREGLIRLPGPAGESQPAARNGDDLADDRGGDSGADRGDDGGEDRGDDGDLAHLVAWARQLGFREPVFARLRANLSAHRASVAARPTQAPQVRGARPQAAGLQRESGRDADARDPHAFARSQAEAALYQVLRQWPPTADQVRLNSKLPIPFGSGDMEVDLLLAVDAIAIEIDGYYHFLTLDAYRRDRHKDYLLQRHGLFVLRFHADEVADPAGLDEILTRIEAAIASRHGRGAFATDPD